MMAAKTGRAIAKKLCQAGLLDISQNGPSHQHDRGLEQHPQELHEGHLYLDDVISRSGDQRGLAKAADSSSDKVKTLAKSMALSRWPTCMAWWEAK